MNTMTFEETVLFAKLLAYALGDRSISLDQLDKESAFVFLKRMADQRYGWTEQQKEQYKALVDTCLHLI